MRAVKRYLTPLGLMVVLALSLSGCIHLDRNVALNSDGTGTYVLTLGINDQLLSLAGDQTATQMDALGAKVKQEGGSYREYDLAGYTYWAYTRPFSSISQLNSFLTQMPGSTGAPTGGAANPSSADTVTFTEQSGFLSKTFHVTGHLSLQAPAGTTDGSGTGGPDMSQYLKDLRDSFAVTMPGSISAHSGGVVNGNTITYTVHYGEQTDIDVTGGGLDMAVVTPIAAGGAGILVVIAAIVGYLIWRSRAKPAQPVAHAAYGAAPVAPGAPASPIWAAPPDAPAAPVASADSPTAPIQPE